MCVDDVKSRKLAEDVFCIDERFCIAFLLQMDFHCQNESEPSDVCLNSEDILLVLHISQSTACRGD